MSLQSCARVATGPVIDFATAPASSRSGALPQLRLARTRAMSGVAAWPDPGDRRIEVSQ